MHMKETWILKLCSDLQNPTSIQSFYLFTVNAVLFTLLLVILYSVTSLFKIDLFLLCFLFQLFNWFAGKCLNREKRYVIVLVPYAPSPTLTVHALNYRAIVVEDHKSFPSQQLPRIPFGLWLLLIKCLWQCLLASELATVLPLVMKNRDKHLNNVFYLLSSLSNTLREQSTELWLLTLNVSQRYNSVPCFLGVYPESSLNMLIRFPVFSHVSFILPSPVSK